jgi:hypothetical protein
MSRFLPDATVNGEAPRSFCDTWDRYRVEVRPAVGTDIGALADRKLMQRSPTMPLRVLQHSSWKWPGW